MICVSSVKILTNKNKHEMIADVSSCFKRSNIQKRSILIFSTLFWISEHLDSEAHTCTSRWSNGGGQFSPGENFSRIFRGEENFSPPLFSEFWCFPCGFWCQNSNWGGKYAQNSKWGEKKRGGDRPLTGGDKFSRIFLRGGKLTFPPLSLTLVHVWADTHFETKSSLTTRNCSL